MGRLSTATAESTAIARTLIASGLTLVLCQGCDGEARSEAPRSRVQAVVGSTSPGGGSVTPAPTPHPAAQETAQTPRPPLCKGQLETNGTPFKPKTALSRRGSADDELSKDPLNDTDGRWTWINLWAAWCIPCKEEIPLLLSWEKNFSDRMRFVFLSLDDDERQLQQFLEKQTRSGLRSSYWLAAGPARTDWLSAAGFDGDPELPMQLLLDPQGRLRCKVQGSVEEGDRKFLEGLLH